MATARQPNNSYMASVDSTRRVAEGLTSTTTTALAFAAITTTSSSGSQQLPGTLTTFSQSVGASKATIRIFLKDLLGLSNPARDLREHRALGKIGKLTIMDLGLLIFMEVILGQPRVFRIMRILNRPISHKVKEIQILPTRQPTTSIFTPKTI